MPAPEVGGAVASPSPGDLQPAVILQGGRPDAWRALMTTLVSTDPLIHSGSSAPQGSQACHSQNTSLRVLAPTHKDPERRGSHRATCRHHRGCRGNPRGGSSKRHPQRGLLYFHFEAAARSASTHGHTFHSLRQRSAPTAGFAA